ncbi:MAG: sodium-translocating pyrophosphatase [Thermoguttaceae bacterium]|nr:sodium-translocating pyrophosphatase [Thermoguttaceae bacterium]
MKTESAFLNTLRGTMIALTIVLGFAFVSGTYAADAKPADAKAGTAEVKKDVPKAAPVKAEAPKAEEKKAEAPKADEKKAEVPKADEKKADAKKVDAKDCPTCKGNAAGGDDRVKFQSKYGVYWVLALLGAIAALCFARVFYVNMMKCDEGNEEMITIAAAVREGADAYLWQQYKVVALFFFLIWAFLMYLAWGLHVQSVIVPWAFLTGGFFSGLAGWCGMKTATWASSRTAAGAQKSLNQGLQVAFRSGAVMGLTVVGLGLLDIVLWFGTLYWVFPAYLHWNMGLVEITVIMLCFGMGASSQALFARVGGGIYTKAADVGADLVGKVEAGIPEDDKRNPATIADNVGDNVGDVAGMGADLYESYCGSILSSAALGVAAYTALGSGVAQQLNALFLPILIAAVGIVLSIFGIFLVRTKENADQGTLLKALGKGVNLPSLLIAVFSVLVARLLVPDYPWLGFSVVTGLAAGWLIGKWTEYRTSYEYKPTKAIAEQSKTGPATVIIAGIAEGMYSTWAPVVIVGIATLLSFGCATGFKFDDVQLFSIGLYGVGIAAVGMLSTLGVTLATDAYGPIADNAGGNAEMSGLPEEVRERTDALDSLGNTTAATGKGFAIGSAALTALALLAAYVEEVRVGFERWGDVAVQRIEKADGEAGYYKVSEKFVVKYLGKEATDKAREDAKAAGKTWVPATYLVLPEQAKSPNVNKPIERGATFEINNGLVKDGEKGKEITWKHSNEAWASIAVDRAKPALISGGVAQCCPFIPYKMQEKNGKSEIVVDMTQESGLVPVQSATMMDWMNYYSCNLLNPKVLVGIFVGAMLVFVFAAMTMMAVGRAASGMVEEVRRQFRENPGIMEYKVKPDYKSPVRISTQAAQREMVIPSIIGLITPVFVGLILGVTGVIGMLVGGLTSGFCVAVYMANAGGAWDNAKKYIETGVLGGKRSDAHKATVVGDTVGDPFKDTTGPSLNILIKLMSMVSVVAAGLIVKYSLEALGIF